MKNLRFYNYSLLVITIILGIIDYNRIFDFYGFEYWLILFRINRGDYFYIDFLYSGFPIIGLTVLNIRYHIKNRDK